MSLLIPTYPDPTRVSGAAGAYAWINAITINVTQGRLQLDIPVWASEADYLAGVQPIDTVNVRFGEAGIPDLAAFMAENQAAWAAIGAAFYAALANHPAFAGATQVP